MTNAIEASGLVKRFGKTTALAGVDLVARPGTVLGVLGPNGAGKTTAVRILATLLRADGGQARVCGYDVGRQSHQVRQLIGLTGQYASVDEGLSGINNLIMIGRLLGQSRRGARARATELLERFDLAEAAQRPVKTYSGGMRRRLDLAASLVGHPRVLYLDEPTTGLDPRSRTDVWDMIRKLVTGGVTVLLTTQYLDEADQLANDIVVIDHGKVIAAGTSRDLKTRVGGQVVAAQPVEPADVDATRRILEAFARDDDAIHVDGEAVTVSIADGVQLGQVARRLDDEGIHMDELALRRPSLDEVFLAITGHMTEENELGVDADAERRSS
jgi:oleandomycin transport system ATP-binding protein